MGEHHRRAGDAPPTAPGAVPTEPPPPPVRATKLVMSDRLFDVLRAAGLADEDTRRVVIDLRAGQPAVVYAERYGTASLIDVLGAISEVAVRVSERGGAEASGQRAGGTDEDESERTER